MKFSEWLYDELFENGIIDDADVSISELNRDYLYGCTELDEDDLISYEKQFTEYCEIRALTPEIDI